MKLAASIVLFMFIGVIVAYSFGIFMIGIVLAISRYF